MWWLLMRKSLPWGINTPFIGVWPVISRSPRSQLPRLLHSSSHPCISVRDHQSLSPFGRANSRRTKEDSSQATVPPLEATPSLFSLGEDDLTQPTRSWFCWPMAKPVGRVQIHPDSAVGSSFTVVGSTSPTHKNSHQFSHKKQKTGSSDGSWFSAAVRGYRTCPHLPDRVADKLRGTDTTLTHLLERYRLLTR